LQHSEHTAAARRHSDVSPSLADYLGVQGRLTNDWPGFEARPGQLQLAEHIATTIAERGTLLAEAATGTGKTLAYLLPVLLSGKTALLSTGTKNLQEQLFFRDLPAIRELLRLDVQCSLLKGRGNYLCHYRWQQHQGQPQLRSLPMQQQLAAIRQWLPLTASGDLSEVEDLPDNAAVRSWVTSTTDNCLGSECPNYDDCFVYQAREKARQADIVVVNHHLLFADLALREQGFGEVLPAVDVVIVDEAHQAPAVASAFFGRSLSQRQLTELARDAQLEVAQQSGALALLQPALDDLNHAQRELTLALSRVYQRQAMQRLLEQSDHTLWDELGQALQLMHTSLHSMSERSKGLQQISERSQSLLSTLQLCLRGDDSHVCWFEPRPRGFAIHATPLHIEAMFERMRSTMQAAWVFTSATLTVNKDFSYFAERLGLTAAQQLAVDSPFDYDSNTLLWIPESLPAPGGTAHTRALMQALLPVLEANAGRAFLLFTTHRAVRDAADWLNSNSDFNLQVQGTAPRANLLQQFRRQDRSLLLGAASFWEGVDVVGSDLSIVVIDKLPFATPDDPVYQARADAINAAGGSAFADLSLPEAVLTLKQGVGRLVRHQHDYGLIVLGDQRVRQKSYGRRFLQSLPVRKQCATAQQAIDFLQQKQQQA